MMRSRFDRGAGSLESMGRPKLLFHSFAGDDSSLMPNKDESGAGLSLSRGRPKLVVQFLFDLESIGILNKDESGAGLSLSRRRPKMWEKVQSELVKPVDGLKSASVEMPSARESGSALSDV